MSKSARPSGALRRWVDATTADDDEVHEAPQDSARFCPEDYAVGQVLSGRFRVEHVIGVGSMGVVLAARHLELEQRVAIKFIRPEMQKLPSVMSRFAREAKAAVSIKSEHVAQVLDVGTAEGIGPYIVMEYLEGRDLGSLLELDGRLSVGRAVHYALQACEALAVAHASGVTHRDIKPENLFLTRQGGLERIKLLDFGISKASLTGQLFGDELSSSEGAYLLGTPLYMSPEQIRVTAEVDHRTDIWSLGAVLYELVTARSAFSADSIPELWTCILEAAPTPLAACLPDAPEALVAVIERCLEKDPGHRFQNVAELALALAPFAPGSARIHAQRAAAILGLSAASGSGAGTSSRRAPALRALAIGAALGAALLLWLAARSVEPRGAGLPAVAPAVAVALPLQGVAVAEELAPSPSRTVLVESVPSGARVDIGGQVIGVTPLSTLLPNGTLELAVSKPGFEEARAFVQVDAAPPGATPVLARVVLREMDTRGPSPINTAAPPPVARPARAPRAVTVSAPPAARPFEARRRARLVDDAHRARLVD